MEVPKRAYEFLHAHCTAEIQSAKLTLELMFQKPAGVGEHSESDFTDNLTSALRRLHDAEGMLETLERYGGFN